MIPCFYLHVLFKNETYISIERLQTQLNTLQKLIQLHTQKQKTYQLTPIKINTYIRTYIE